MARREQSESLSASNFSRSAQGIQDLRANASYATWVTAAELASKIADRGSVTLCDCYVFTFLSEMPWHMQQAFIEEMGVSKDAVPSVAMGFSLLAGFDMACTG